MEGIWVVFGGCWTLNDCIGSACCNELEEDGEDSWDGSKHGDAEADTSPELPEGESEVIEDLCWPTLSPPRKEESREGGIRCDSIRSFGV